MNDMDDKLIQMARDAGFIVGISGSVPCASVDQLAALKSAILADAAKDVEPVAIYHGRCVIDCGEHGHLDMQLLKMIPAGSALVPASTLAAAQALNAELVARVEVLEKDAARYRWLRDKAVWLTTSEKAPWCVIGTCANDAQPCDRDELDTAIDAALTKGQS